MNKLLIISIGVLLCGACSSKQTQYNEDIIGDGKSIENVAGDEHYAEQPEEERGNDLSWFNPIGVIGTGVVDVKEYRVYNEGTDIQDVKSFKKITLYNDAKCTDVYSRYNYVDVYGTPKGKNIIPVVNSVDYGWYSFICTADKGTAFEVAINKNDRKYVKKEENIEYYNWEKFFNLIICVNEDEDSGNRFRELPDDAAAIVIVEEQDADNNGLDDVWEQEIKLDGEWLHVNFLKLKKSAWLRWRKGNDIIVSFSLDI
jgi:hypothetical protein